MPASRSTTARKSTPTPRNSQSKTAKKQVSKASGWKKNKPHELELPSGEVCLVRRPGMETLLAEGLFGDALMPIIQDQISAAKAGKPKATADADEAFAKMLENPTQMAEMFDAFDKVTVRVVQEPKVAYHRRETGAVDENGKKVWEVIPDEDRDDNIVYTDDVEMNDKMFIFQYVVGGSSDLATFRQQFS